MKELRVVSLFSGIGGFEKGLELADVKYNLVFASEIDVFAREAFLANFDTSNLYGDITMIDEKDIPSHDLLVAGFPCQAFSIAGKRKGFEDTRGTLFFDIARILNEKRPKYILLENVKNLISHDKGKTINEILHVLEDLDYAVDFTVINSSESGVPQNRERTYIIGIHEGVKEAYMNDMRNSKINNLKQELNLFGFKSFNFFSGLKYDNNFKVIEDVMQNDTEERYYLSNEKVNSYLESIDIEFENVRKQKIIKLFDLPKDVHNDLERQRRVYSVNGIAPTVLARSDSPKILLKRNSCLKIRKITPSESFYMQGFDKEFVNNIKNAGISNTQMYKQSGNAVTPQVIEGIIEHLKKEYLYD